MKGRIKKEKEWNAAASFLRYARYGFARREGEGFAMYDSIRGSVSGKGEAAAMLAVWTRKEALGKYIGTGLAENLSVCTAVPSEGAAFYTEWLEEAGVRYALTFCAKDPPTFVAIEEDR